MFNLTNLKKIKKQKINILNEKIKKHNEKIKKHNEKIKNNNEKIKKYSLDSFNKLSHFQNNLKLDLI